VGGVTLSRKQAQALQVPASTPWSPVMEKCALRTCAQLSYQQAEEQIEMLTGLQMGHSSLHRLVNRTDIAVASQEQVSSHASIDGGKIRLRPEADEAEAKSRWKDYKAVALSNGLYEAFFQDNEALQTWSRDHTLAAKFLILGDGHDGGWNIARTFGGQQVQERVEVLDWFHLMENLHKVEMSGAERKGLRRWLWRGQVEQVWPILKEIDTHQAGCFRRYLEKHLHRLPNYEAYQEEGLCLG